MEKGTKEVTKSLNVEQFRISQNYQEMCDIQQEVITVAIKKPSKRQFFWICPDPKMYFEAAIYEDDINNELYVVAPQLLEALQGEWKLRILVPYLIKGGHPGLWPIGQADENGYLNPWTASALQIVANHSATWLRLQSVRAKSSYDIIKPINPIEDPEWAWSQEELLEKAFNGKVIESLDHPVIKELRGV